MAKGDGGIRQVKKDGKPAKDSQGRFIWEVRISTGWNPVEKRYGIISRRVHGTKADARKLRDELNRQVENGIDPNAGRVSFYEFAKQRLEVRTESENLSENTVVYYNALLNHVKPIIGHVALQNINAAILDALYTQLRADGVSNGTIGKVHKYVKQVLNEAVNLDAIMRNPANKLKPPKSDPVNRRSLTADEAARLLTEIVKAETDAYEAEQSKELRQRDDGKFERGYIRGLLDISCCIASRIVLATGMRRGEVLALTWDSLNADDSSLTVKASITVNMNVKEPKSEAGKRTVTLDPATLHAIQTWRVFQRGELAKIGVKATKDTPICCDSKGSYINPSNFSRWWYGFVDEHGFSGLRFHELRHTQATLLLAQGVDVKTVQTRLGHSDASITLNTYSHAVKDNDRAAADLLGRLLTGKPKSGRIIKFAKSA